MKHTNQHWMPNTLTGIVDELLNGAFLKEDSSLDHSFKQNYPPSNILESETHYTIELLAPVREKDAFKIQIEKNTLTIQYEKPLVQNQSTTKTIRTEFALNSFKRTFSLSNKIETERVQAKYNNGILHILLTKKVEEKTENQTIVVE